MKEIPNVFYYYIHSKIWERARGKSIQRRELKGYLAEWRIPRNLRELIVRELIILGLVESHKRHQVKINKPKFNDKELKEYYIKLKVY